MKILFLTTQLPYPPTSGGVIKSWRLVEHWSRHADLRVICALKNEDAAELDNLRHRLPGLEIHGVKVEKPRTPLNLLKSYLFAPTLNVYRNASTEISKLTEKWAPVADVILVDHYEMAQFVPTHTHAKVVLHTHNAEYVMWQRLSEIEANPLKRFLLRFESRRIQAAEREYSKRADLVLAAPNDIDALVAIGVERSKCAVTYHLGDDSMLELPATSFQETEKALLFVGTLTWEANIDGLLWFLKSVWPALKSQEPEIRFYIIGKNPDKRLLDATAGDAAITFTGFVDDLEPYHRKARVFVIPLRFGSGIKVKLLHALYRGIPVVTTPIGVEGLNAVSAEHLYITNDISEQVAHIIRLLSDEALWHIIQTHARLLASRYTWKELLQNHDDALKQLLAEAEK